MGSNPAHQLGNAEFETPGEGIHHVQNRFKPGQSGNPKGRPKGSRHLSTIFREVRNQRIKVKDGEGTRYVTKLEAALTQLANKAATGDLKAITEFVRLDQSMPIDERDLVAPVFQVQFIEAEDGRPKYPLNNPNETGTIFGEDD